MEWCILLTSLLCILQCILPLGIHSQIQEYCSMESFSPTCKNSQVVVMKHAVYGRMKVGKCLEDDFFIGCSANVMQLLDNLCSGQTNCNVPIYNSRLREKVSCMHKSLTAYLEASYDCKTVYSPRNQQCHSPTKIAVTKESLPVASMTSVQTSCGLHGTPWILEARPGQQIDLSLLDFSWNNDTDINTRCPVNYGYILDMENDNVIHICGGDTERDKHVLLSVGHSIQVVLEATAVQNNNFMLYFQAIGCPDYQPIPHSWVQKENDSLVIGCVASDKTWKLKCVDNRWLGAVGNCTPPPEPVDVITHPDEEIIVPSGSSIRVPYVSNNHVVVFTMACVTLLICCVIVILGVFCIKRYEVKIKKYKYNASTTIHKDGRLSVYRDSNTTYRPVTTLQMNTMHPPAYTFPLPKDDKAPKLPPRTIPMGQGTNNQQTEGRDTGAHYDNVMDSQFNGGHYVNEDNESVQYYVLENPAENNSGGQNSQEMYQRINVEDNPFA